MQKLLLVALVARAFAVPALAINYNPSMADDASGATLLDLNDVLNSSVDSVPDAPEFVTPPDGSYLLGIQSAKAEKYKTTNKDTQQEEERVRLKIFYTVLKTVELSNAEEQPVADGSLFTEQFMTNEQGLSYFKRQSKNVLGEDNIKGSTIGDILTELGNGHTFSAEVKQKKTKGKDSSGAAKEFVNIQVRIKAGSEQKV